MATDGDLVQIVIPCFNGQRYLEETLVSIQKQTHKNFDCLMVDDASADNSSLIFTRLTQGDLRFRMITNEENRGESYSVNRGWDQRKGHLICFLSFDDPQPVDWLENMIKFRNENPGFIVYYPNRLVIGEKSETLRREVLFDWSKSLLREDLLCIVSVGAIIDSNFLPIEFEPRISEVTFPSDLIQYLKISNYGDGLRHPSYFSVWREHDEGISAKKRRTLAKEFTKAMQLYLRSVNDNKEKIQESAVFANVVRMLQRDFSFPRSLILGFRIFLGEFKIRTLKVSELLKLFSRFRQRQNTRSSIRQ